MYFAHDTPREHPSISKEELEYIETTVGEEQDHLRPNKQVRSCISMQVVLTM